MATRKNRKDRKGSRKNRKTQSGGKRRGGEWAKAVKRVYEEMKRKDNSVSLRDAMKEASRRKKAGNL